MKTIEAEDDKTIDDLLNNQGLHLQEQVLLRILKELKEIRKMGRKVERMETASQVIKIIMMIIFLGIVIRVL